MLNPHGAEKGAPLASVVTVPPVEATLYTAGPELPLAVKYTNWPSGAGTESKGVQFLAVATCVTVSMASFMSGNSAWRIAGATVGADAGAPPQATKSAISRHARPKPGALFECSSWN